MSWKIKLLLYLSLFATGHSTAMCQISGIVNTYTKVTAVDYVCNFITVSSPTGFAAGDKVLLIQMQGASIVQGLNNNAFGDITAIGDAGNYEFAIIDHFSANDVYFTKTLLRTYTPAGSVQMISVPQYAAVSIDAELTAKAWDGNTGGVIVIESSDAITMNANINASKAGFIGGLKSPDGGNCGTYPFNGSGFYYYTTSPNVQAGQKGQGIAAFITNGQGGIGKQANGGGGGGSHNTGGGGGSNYGAGGRGGNAKCGTSPFGVGGLGLSSTYYNTAINRIFMGGGGGGGQVNNTTSFNGGNGGGIIIIKAVSINANGFTIKTNGDSVDTYFTYALADNGDGNSGGGGGGTVLLDVSNYTTATPVEAYGGKGGNTGYLSNNFGPGGGGGGGVVWLSTSPSSAQVNANVVGGLSGLSNWGAAANKWGAVNGSPGAQLSALSIPQSSSSSSCALPVELIAFQAKAIGKYSVQLNWSTASEQNNHYFSIERSTDGKEFFPLTKVYGQENSNRLTAYAYTDEVFAYDILYYRLKQTDIDGHTVDLGIRKVYPALHSSLDLTAYPNPCKDNLYLQFDKGKQETIKTINLVSAYGELINPTWEETENGMSIHTSLIPAGLYSLMLYTSTDTYVVKVLKEK